MADFKEGLPDATPAFRIILGGPEGMMVGTYPVSPTRAYYFVCGPAPEVALFPTDNTKYSTFCTCICKIA